MKLSKKNKFSLAIAALLLILIVTNPSASAFRTYRGYSTYDGLRRPVNLFILSEWQDGYRKYIGLFGNFIRVDAPVAPVVVQPVVVDSTKNDTSKHNYAISGQTPEGLPIFKKIN